MAKKVYTNRKTGDDNVSHTTPFTNNAQAIFGRSRLSPVGAATLSNSRIGVKQLTISPGDNINKALERLSATGGILYLASGTHLVNEDIYVPTSVQIIGENLSTTTIDFNSQSYQFVVNGTDVYTTGTITSIGSGGTVVTGSGTSWLANVSAGQQLFIDNTWYLIAAVIADTTIILAEPYLNAATYSGTYRIATIKKDIEFSELTIKNSTTTAIDFQDVRDVRMEDVLLLTNNKGFEMTNASFILGDGVTITGSTSNGYELTNAKYFNALPIASVGNGGHGMVLNNVTVSVWLYCANTGNTSDGINATDVTNATIKMDLSGNGSNGLEFVSGCDDCRIDGNVEGNTSDGIKLTATSDDNSIALSNINGNGGYGINIAAASCDNTIILGNHLAGNTSGQVSDSGTATLIRSNIGQADN